MICCTKHIAFLGQDLPFLVCGQLISINQIGNVNLMNFNNQKHYKDCEHKLVNPPLLFLLIDNGASETDNLFVQKHDQDQNRRDQQYDDRRQARERPDVVVIKDIIVE